MLRQRWWSWQLQWPGAICYSSVGKWISLLLKPVPHSCHAPLLSWRKSACAQNNNLISRSHSVCKFDIQSGRNWSGYENYGEGRERGNNVRLLCAVRRSKGSLPPPHSFQKTATRVSVSAFLKGIFFIGFVLFFRGFGAIGPFVNMIYRMCAGDMSRFFIIYIIYVVGLAQGEHAHTLECNSVSRGLGTKGYFFRDRRNTS